MTSTTWERRALFRREAMAHLFIEILYSYRQEKRFLLHEFTVMPEHFHLLMTPSPHTSIQKAVQFVKGGYSHRVGQESQKMEVWQRGFSDHQIRNAADFEQHRDYIWSNAVKRGLVSRPDEYPYCSAAGLFRLDPPPADLAG